MKKYRVDVFDQWWNGRLQARYYIEAESEADARSKAYDKYVKTLICAPLNIPAFETMLVA